MAKMASLHAEKTRVITEDEWDLHYEPLNDSPLETYGKDLELVMKFPDEQIWTLVDSDRYDTAIISGYHLVNRIGYYIAKKPFFPEEIITVPIGREQ
jgi:hypothetical protein